MKEVIVHKKECNNGKNKNDQKIYASMVRMSDNDKFPRRNYCDSLQYTNCILDSRAMFHMTPEVSDFIPVLLDDTEKHIGVADRHHTMAI